MSRKLPSRFVLLWPATLFAGCAASFLLGVGLAALLVPEPEPCSFQLEAHPLTGQRISWDEPISP